MICIGISTSLSFKGFIRSLDEYTIPFVAVIALGLFAAGTLLQLGRDNKSISEQFLALFLFIIFATFSTASNFTHIYTQEMKERVETTAFNDEFSKFKKNLGMMVQVLEGNQAQNQVTVVSSLNQETCQERKIQNDLHKDDAQVEISLHWSASVSRSNHNHSEEHPNL